MGRIVFMMSVSLDGYFEGPEQDLSWHLISDELHRHLNADLAEASWFLDGRVTFELMSAYWPTADQAPDATSTIVEFARIWRDKPKVVYSRTLTEAPWNTTVASRVDPAEVRALQAAAGGDLFVGGAELLASFEEHGLVEEYRIYVHPVTIGAGKPLFRPGSRRSLTLQGTRSFANGVVLLRYTPPAVS